MLSWAGGRCGAVVAVRWWCSQVRIEGEQLVEAGSAPPGATDEEAFAAAQVRPPFFFCPFRRRVSPTHPAAVRPS